MLITCGLWYIVSSLCHLHTNQRKEREQRPMVFLSEQKLVGVETLSDEEEQKVARN